MFDFKGQPANQLEVIASDVSLAAPPSDELSPRLVYPLLDDQLTPGVQSIDQLGEQVSPPVGEESPSDAKQFFPGNGGFGGGFGRPFGASGAGFGRPYGGGGGFGRPYAIYG